MGTTRREARLPRRCLTGIVGLFEGRPAEDISSRLAISLRWAQVIVEWSSGMPMEVVPP